ncbi:hypothetical protein [Thiohalorhabdus methylotrophus]|uniref:Response regulatory domain-containing protein n=1 Tax=Thiohalorhabdus methylotrophus TaxID=3242694 RepID=A0ABV4TX57_9GAMM
MTRNGHITDTELLDVFAGEHPEAGGLDAETVEGALRDLIETLWAEPDPDTSPMEQLNEELSDLTEFLESEETMRLVGAMQEVLGGYAAGSLAWTEAVSSHMKEGAEAIAEELNPDPPREKLESTIQGAGDRDPVVLFVAEDTNRRQELEEAISRNAKGAPVFLDADSFEQARDGSPQLILTHAPLPGSGTGDSFLSEFREGDLWTPVLVFSEHTDAHSRRRMIASGANRVLSPTCSGSQLNRALDGLLD